MNVTTGCHAAFCIILNNIRLNCAVVDLFKKINVQKTATQSDDRLGVLYEISVLLIHILPVIFSIINCQMTFKIKYYFLKTSTEVIYN